MQGVPIRKIIVAILALTVVMSVILVPINWNGEEASTAAPKIDRMVVDVYGQQFEWNFNYPEQGVTSRELHVPVDRQVEVRLHALDVIHSFWVPEWRLKKDAVPGITTRIFVTPDKNGEYTLICTELCGIGHSTMRAPVVVEDDQQTFDQWAGTQDPIPETEPKPGEVTPTPITQ